MTTFSKFSFSPFCHFSHGRNWVITVVFTVIERNLPTLCQIMSHSNNRSSVYLTPSRQIIVLKFFEITRTLQAVAHTMIIFHMNDIIHLISFVMVPLEVVLFIRTTFSNFESLPTLKVFYLSS